MRSASSSAGRAVATNVTEAMAAAAAAAHAATVATVAETAESFDDTGYHTVVSDVHVFAVVSTPYTADVFDGVAVFLDASFYVIVVEVVFVQATVTLAVPPDDWAMVVAEFPGDYTTDFTVMAVSSDVAVNAFVFLDVFVTATESPGDFNVVAVSRDDIAVVFLVVTASRNDLIGDRVVVVVSRDDFVDISLVVTTSGNDPVDDSAVVAVSLGGPVVVAVASENGVVEETVEHVATGQKPSPPPGVSHSPVRPTVERRESPPQYEPISVLLLEEELAYFETVVGDHEMNFDGDDGPYVRRKL